MSKKKKGKVFAIAAACAVTALTAATMINTNYKLEANAENYFQYEGETQLLNMPTVNYVGTTYAYTNDLSLTIVPGNSSMGTTKITVSPVWQYNGGTYEGTFGFPIVGYMVKVEYMYGYYGLYGAYKIVRLDEMGGDSYTTIQSSPIVAKQQNVVYGDWQYYGVYQSPSISPNIPLTSAYINSIGITLTNNTGIMYNPSIGQNMSLTSSTTFTDSSQGGWQFQIKDVRSLITATVKCYYVGGSGNTYGGNAFSERSIAGKTPQNLPSRSSLSNYTFENHENIYDFSMMTDNQGAWTNEQFLNYGQTQYEIGKEEGYSKGYQKGLQTAENGEFTDLIASVVDAPVQAFTNLFNFEILGFNMLNFATSILTVILVISIIKIVTAVT